MDQMPTEGGVNRLRNPKLIFGFILFLAIVGVGAAGYRIFSGINGGFIPTISNSNGVARVQADAESEESQKSKDTDGDGVNDFDELNRYRTSPYLADTDSDGASDREELEQQTDPNCPKGRSCREIAPVGLGNAGNDEPDMDIMKEATTGFNIPPDESDGATAAAELTTEVGANEQLKNLTPSQLRQLLLDSGKITQEQLQGISDEVLMRAYQEIIANQ